PCGWAERGRLFGNASREFSADFTGIGLGSRLCSARDGTVPCTLRALASASQLVIDKARFTGGHPCRVGCHGWPRGLGIKFRDQLFEPRHAWRQRKRVAEYGLLQQCDQNRFIGGIEFGHSV